MDRSVLGTSLITQIGILVHDIDAASAKWAEFLGVDKPGAEWSGAYEDAQTQCKGKATPARAKLAFLNAGQVQIELIEPDLHPSTWRQCLDERGEGIHHIALFVKDMGGQIQKLEGMGMELLQKGEYTGGRYAYLDAMDSLKVVLELLEND